MRQVLAWLLLASLPLVALPRDGGAAALSSELKQELSEAKYVYVSSLRKDGAFSPPSEIWFVLHDDAVWVATRKSSWRARRIRAGRNAAKVRVGSAEGPEIQAVAAIVEDPAIWKTMFAGLAEKYPEGWITHEKAFRDGAASGERVLIRYTPK